MASLFCASAAAAAPRVPWGCDMKTLDAAIALQKWLSDYGLPSQKVELRNVGAGGRGLVATKMLYKGDRLLYVPAPLILTADSEWTCSEAEKLLKDRGLPDWPLLACYLISEAALGRKSRWSSYIAALPQYPSSILQWTAKDVQTHLAATSIIDKAISAIQEAEMTFHDLDRELFSKNRIVFPSKVYTLNNFKWAFGILFSRLVRLPSLGEQLALVPFGDMLNHSTKVNTFLDFDSSSKSIVCCLDRKYETDEEIFISYGKRSNGELLLSYGFLPDEPNPENFVSIKLKLDEDDAMFKAKESALRKYGLPSEQVFPVRVSGWPSQLIAFARLIACSSSSDEQHLELASHVTEKSTKSKKLPDHEDEIEAYQLVLSSCETAIASCNSYLQEMDQVPASQTGNLSRLAVTLCRSELVILYRMQYVLRSELKLLKHGPLRGTGLLNKAGLLNKMGLRI